MPESALLLEAGDELTYWEITGQREIGHETLLAEDTNGKDLLREIPKNISLRGIIKMPPVIVSEKQMPVKNLAQGDVPQENPIQRKKKV